MLKTPAELREAPSHCDPLCLRRQGTERSISFLPRSCALVGKTGEGGKVKRKGERREINGERKNMVKREEPCITFGLVAAKSHFLQLQASTSCWAVQKKLPQERDFNF